MKIYSILSAFILLCALGACQTEYSTKTSQPNRKIKAKAFLHDNKETRAQITYGNPERAEEIFMWNVKDYFYVFNLSKISEWGDYDLQLEIVNPTDIKDNEAVFESVGVLPSNIRIEKGDTVLVIYGGEARRYQPVSGYFDERNIFTVNVGTEANAPQYIVSNPDDSSLKYMSKNLRMYDIVIAKENDNLPDIHFKHLSSIMRVTLHNKTGKDLYPTKLEFKYPTKSPTATKEDIIDRNPSFFNTTLYFGVETEENGEFYLKVYDSDDFYNGTPPYTHNIGTTVNWKQGTTDAGEFLKNGDSYELYLSTVPRVGNDSYGEDLTINLIIDHKTDTPYSITINKFGQIIKAGNRYWFNLTASSAGDLVLTSKYNPDDYKSNSTSVKEDNSQDNGE